MQYICIYLVDRLQMEDGITYVSLKRSGLYFLMTTRFNVSPTLGMELLSRLVRVFKDYMGILNEEAVRKNFVLIYELLDEVMVCTVSTAAD